MSDNNNEQAMQMPTPDPALKRLDKLGGSWTMKGRTLDSDEDNIAGRTTFEWLPGGFFLQQRFEMNFAGFGPCTKSSLLTQDIGLSSSCRDNFSCPMGLFVQSSSHFK